MLPSPECTPESRPICRRVRVPLVWTPSASRRALPCRRAHRGKRYAVPSVRLEQRRDPVGQPDFAARSGPRALQRGKNLQAEARTAPRRRDSTGPPLSTASRRDPISRTPCHFGSWARRLPSAESSPPGVSATPMTGPRGLVVDADHSPDGRFAAPDDVVRQDDRNRLIADRLPWRPARRDRCRAAHAAGRT